MVDYALYLESGPKHKKTMVHVLDLLGCVVRGATTEEALANTPDGIRAFLQFLQKSGEPVNPTNPFTTHIEVYVSEGSWLGEGDPTPGFGPDFNPLSREDLKRYIKRLKSIHDNLLEMIQSIRFDELYILPPDGHRSIFGILEHTVEGEYAFIRSQIGPDKTILRARKAIERGNPLLAFALMDFWQVITDRLSAFTDIDLARQVRHGQTTWSANRTLRRLLEHTWEHHEEIRDRLKK